MTDLNGEVVKAPELPELEFEENCHIYRLDGSEIPSVSRVMEPLSKANYSGISEKVLDRAASKGTSVHNSIEIYVKYGIIDVNPEHKSYFDGFLDWWEEVQPEVVGSEIRVYHKILQYAGTIDLLCYINRKLIIPSEDARAGHFGFQEVFRETVGRHTGLIDKNGKKIFEGDIVRYEDAEADFEGYHDNIFMNCGSVLLTPWNGIIFTNRQTVEMDDLYVSETSIDAEVIGNIHENPELIGGGSNE